MAKTAECVTPMHPDKTCDYIADCILDAYLAEDKESRVAIEVMGGHGLITINGEVTSRGKPDVEKVVRNLVGNSFKIVLNISEQSSEIARGVDTGGAGDQGIMIGYACNENEEMIPLEFYFARKICNHIYLKHPYDGKVQVTLSWDKGKEYQDATIVASFQNVPAKELDEIIKDWINKNFLKFYRIFQHRTYVNPAGDWNQGGFDADTGLSGRKIVMDSYGPEIPIGGGSFSGKDYTKVDRSGAYMARKIAVDLLKKYNAKEVYAKLAYVIGVKEPVMAVAIIDGREEGITGYDLTPKGIREYLKLDQVKFSETSNWGHFGRGFEWR
jgi:S-adenosylmethionine synthetase